MTIWRTLLFHLCCTCPSGCLLFVSNFNLISWRMFSTQYSTKETQIGSQWAQHKVAKPLPLIGAPGSISSKIQRSVHELVDLRLCVGNFSESSGASYKADHSRGMVLSGYPRKRPLEVSSVVTFTWICNLLIASECHDGKWWEMTEQTKLLQ